jgi:hypothetical protein
VLVLRSRDKPNADVLTMYTVLEFSYVVGARFLPKPEELVFGKDK